MPENSYHVDRPEEVLSTCLKIPISREKPIDSPNEGLSTGQVFLTCCLSCLALWSPTSQAFIYELLGIMEYPYLASYLVGEWNKDGYLVSFFLRLTVGNSNYQSNPKTFKGLP